MRSLGTAYHGHVGILARKRICTGESPLLSTLRKSAGYFYHKGCTTIRSFVSIKNQQRWEKGGFSVSSKSHVLGSLEHEYESFPLPGVRSTKRSGKCLAILKSALAQMAITFVHHSKQGNQCVLACAHAQWTEWLRLVKSLIAIATPSVAGSSGSDYERKRHVLFKFV